MNEVRHLYIPLILGTTRKGRMSAYAAQFMLSQLQKREGVTTDLIDIAELRLPVDDAGEGVKDGSFSTAMERADGIVIVSPEYNHSFPGLLKHVLDSCLKEYIHKAAGIVGVASGAFGGTRVIEHFQPVLRNWDWFPYFGTSILVRSKRFSTREDNSSTRLMYAGRISS